MDWVEAIKAYAPQNEQEKSDRERILYCIDVFDDILTRDNGIAHITSSAFAVNKKRDKALMVYHNIYKSWSWTGGHADGESNLLEVALRELREETGIKNPHPVIEDIFSLDTLPVLGHIKKGKYISPHLHFSVSYLVEADENETLRVKEDENSGVRWIPVDKVVEYSNEPHMRRVYEKLIIRMKALKI